MSDAAPTESPRQRARRLYKSMAANIKQLEHNVLKLMRHPDSTDEQIATTRARYIAMHKSHMEVKATLCDKFPDPRWGITEPWNNKEYL